MISAEGWLKYSIWEHSTDVRQLYEQRCRREAEEMTCAAQAAELLAEFSEPGESLLDAGCGSGYFYHSLATRQIPLDYHGIDASPTLIDIGQRILPEYGLPPDRLRVMRIEDLDAEVDHVLCMNVLSNIDNYHRPLERLLHAARRSLVLRESCGEPGHYSYVVDEFLDPGFRLRVYVNMYPLSELLEFIHSYGFATVVVEDQWTGGRPELVIGYPHHWTFIVARRRAE